MTTDTPAQDNLFRLTGVGVVETDLATGRLVRANRTFCDMVGYGEAELQAMTYLELTHPDDRGRDAASFATLGRGELQGGTSLTRLLRKDGQVVWLELAVTVLGEGPGARNLTVATDVTDRKRAEDALHESEQRRAFLLALSDALRPLSDPDDIHEAVTRTAMTHFGADRLYYCEIEGGEAIIRRDAARAGLPSVVGRYPLGSMPLFRAVLDAGRPFVVEDAHTSELLDEALRRLCLETQVVSFLDVPVVKEGEPVGLLCVVQGEPRRWTELEVALAEEVAERTWAAVERARAEAALRDAKSRLQLIADLVPDLLWDSEPDGSTHWYNGRWLEYTGQSLEEALVWGWMDVVHPDDREGSARRYHEMVKSGERLRQEHRIRRYDGEYRWFVVNAYPEKDERGEVVKVYGAATDIHESRLMNEALRESEERLRLTVEGVRDYAIFTLDPERRVTSWNPGAERVFGYRAGEIVGGSGDVLFTPEDRAAGVPEHEVHTARDEGRADDDRWHLRRGGTRFFASGVVAPLRDGERLLGFVKVARDLTEQRASELERERLLARLEELNETLEQRVAERTEALQASERRFSQAFFTNPIPACMTTFGLERETFVEVNDAFLELTGYAREEIVGHTSRELGMWSSNADLKRLSEAQRDSHGYRNLELRLRTKEGVVKDILMSAEVIRLDGSDGYLKMFYDISDRKRTEEEMHRAVQAVMNDASWFSRGLIEQLSRIRTGGEAPPSVELSRRERQVLGLIAGGLSNEAIASELGLSAQTVRNYISTIYSKLGVNSRGEAIVWARERGMTGK